MYRLTRKAKQRRKWRPREEAPEDQRRSPHWEPPLLRRRITIEDFDGCEPTVHVIELRRTSRIDCYDATVDGKPWAERIGWSRVLDGLRRALPRVAGDRCWRPDFSAVDAFAKAERPA